MCGIVGIVRLSGQPVDPELLRRMCTALRHRGPDEEGYHTAAGVGLGQRRLSIIDLSTGTQPMCNEDGTLWVTYNGEIYNFQELRPNLEALGHRYATVSDTETILHAYEQYGKDCVKQFRGMFAFAIWNQRTQTAFLARDRVGKKPLFYTEAAGQFLFASEMHALLLHPEVNREIDLTALDDYLTLGYVPGPRTIYRNVFKLPPGCHATIKASTASGERFHCEVERYWRLEYAPKSDVSLEDAADGLLEVLTEAVRLRMIADVPLGALLSGGIDSSIVVALMSRLSSQPVKTFSIGFEEQAFDELPFARMVAKQYGTDHHEFVVRPNAVEIMPLLVRNYSEPFADSSAIPSYYVSQMTRQHVKVALNGDGGDESCAGYERYLACMMAEHYQRVPALLRRGVLEPLSTLIPDTLPRRNRLRQARRFLESATKSFSNRYLHWMSILTPDVKKELYTPRLVADLEGHDGTAWLRGMLETARARYADPLDAVLSVDVESYLPYDLLVKMDIAAMACSLEARSPFLDHKVMEYCARLPSKYKVRGGKLKVLLKHISRDLLPAENLKRRKMGFGVPVGAWMRNEMRPLLEDALLSTTARSREWLRSQVVDQMVREHVGGIKDHAHPLWALLCLELWLREFEPGRAA